MHASSDMQSPNHLSCALRLCSHDTSSSGRHFNEPLQILLRPPAVIHSVICNIFIHLKCGFLIVLSKPAADIPSSSATVLESTIEFERPYQFTKVSISPGIQLSRTHSANIIFVLNDPPSKNNNILGWGELCARNSNFDVIPTHFLPKYSPQFDSRSFITSFSN